MTTVKSCGNCSNNVDGECAKFHHVNCEADQANLPCGYINYARPQPCSVESEWMPRLSCLLGKTLKRIDVDYIDSKIMFETFEGEKYMLFHDQTCCEQVVLESVVGDIFDLLKSPILMSECSTNKLQENDKVFTSKGFDSSNESGTWSFYKFATIKGYVDIRWAGISNGCYSEEVDFVLIED